MITFATEQPKEKTGKKGRTRPENSFFHVAEAKVLEVLRVATKPLKVDEIVDSIINSVEEPYPDAVASIKIHVYNVLKDYLSNQLVITEDMTAPKRKPKLYCLIEK
jgi:hypothetical protein